MFEISVACKYLLPRRRQLSVSIISLISVGVISLVVWLIVVFFSVTDGLEKSWIHKLTALTAPARITPTDPYYQSYYYQIDSISDASGYNSKTISEKFLSENTDPYDPNTDEEIPTLWPEPDRDAQGSIKDLVKLAYAALNDVKGVSKLKGQDFELTASQIHIEPFRGVPSNRRGMFAGSTQSALSHPAYLGNFESDNPTLGKALLPITLSDVTNLLGMTEVSTTISDESNVKKNYFSSEIFQKRLQAFFKQVKVSELQISSQNWILPSSLLPTDFEWKVSALFKEGSLLKIVIPQDLPQLALLEQQLKEDLSYKVVNGTLHRQGPKFELRTATTPPLAITSRTPLILAQGTRLSVNLQTDSLKKAKRIQNIQFEISAVIQETPLQGKVFYRGLEISKADYNQTFSETQDTFPLWIYALNNKEDVRYILPKDPDVGEGILLPKGFKEGGVLLGDRGYLTYYTPTASMVQEQRLPIYVAGFYDPGIIPIGAKFILADHEVISIIRAAHNQNDRIVTNGINVRFKDYHQADTVKAQLVQNFKKNGIDRYWKVETYNEYEFTKEIMRELRSQKHIFTVIAVAIIIVACSNIISMLIILVNDKKIEIGILRSMGATSKSIALIFGTAGALIGVLGSVIGVVLAIVTLKNLQSVVDLISRIQGYDLFNSAFYGESIPQELSLNALSFVLVATVFISLLAGIVPAVKACLLKPSSILRSSG